MTIRSKTLRLALLYCTIIVAIIIGVQLYWLQKVYKYEEKQFNINVSKSVKGLYDVLELVNDVSDNGQKAIENPQPDLYLIRIDCTPNLDILWKHLKAELTDFDVYTDCKAAIYSVEQKKYVAEEYIDLPDSYHATDITKPLPDYKKTYNYLELFFPHRGQYILKQMVFWIASSALLLLALVGFAASFFYLYKQKFLNETQKDFVNNFTHEFKTPLSVIKIATDVLKQPGISEKPERLSNYTNIIAQQTTHLQAQVQRLLEIAFTDRTSLSLDVQDAQLSDIVKQAIADVEPLIVQKNANVKFNNLAVNDNIKADKNYLQLAFVNLIENALKYSDKPIIQIDLTEKNNDYQITIADNGIGIDAVHHKKIFDKFYRVPSGELHNSKGFGLGLNFVKKVVDAHSGKIAVHSLLGNGSTFTLTLPKNIT
jgi:two-component system, OmpR family, phosphate regulon sensor histidine kinase PhoR